MRRHRIGCEVKMAGGCCGGCESSPKRIEDRAWRRVLWLALAINTGMFAVGIFAGVTARSASRSPGGRARPRPTGFRCPFPAFARESGGSGRSVLGGVDIGGRHLL